MIPKFQEWKRFVVLDASGCDHFDWRHLQGHKSKPLDLRHEVVSLHVDAGSAWLSRGDSDA